jgi:hypothetical protein
MVNRYEYTEISVEKQQENAIFVSETEGIGNYFSKNGGIGASLAIIFKLEPA